MTLLQWKRQVVLLVFAGLVGASLACATNEGVDVSHEAAFAAMIGREYLIVGDVDAYGIKNEDRDSSAAYVTLIPPPGISGPEVAFIKRLQKGGISVLPLQSANFDCSITEPTTSSS